MRFGEFIVGEYAGVNPDDSFGSQILVRVGEPTDKSPNGFQERIEYFPFDPKTGVRTLPAELVAGCIVCVEVKVQSKGYRSADRGISGMAVKTLKSLSIWEDKDGKKVVANDSVVLHTELTKEEKLAPAGKVA